MPRLSEEEQRECVGGTVVLVDRKGNVLRASDHKSLIPDFWKKEKDEDHVYWFVMDKNEKTITSYVSDGSLHNNTLNGGMNDMDMEGSAVNKNVLEFLSPNTSVEWGMALKEDDSISGYYGRIVTSNDEGNVELTHHITGYTEWYHSHPKDDRAPEDFGPSSGDYEQAQILTSGEDGFTYTECTVYEARTGEWITYYGKKDEGEVYENEMKRH